MSVDCADGMDLRVVFHSQGDSPEDLLDGTGKSLGRVGRLGSGETDELSTCNLMLVYVGSFWH